MRRRIVNRPRRAVAVVILVIFSAAMARTIVQAVRVVGKMHAAAMAADEQRYQEGTCYHRDAEGRLEVWGAPNPPHWEEAAAFGRRMLVWESPKNPLWKGLWTTMNYNAEDVVTYGGHIDETPHAYHFIPSTKKKALTQKTGKL